MELSRRDIGYSIILHLGLVSMLVAVNPFTVHIRNRFNAVEVNVITLPPRGNPDLIKGNELKPVIPQATKEDKAAVPLESKKTTPKTPDKKKPTKHQDEGYKGNAALGEASQAGGADVSDKLGPGSPFGTVSVDNASFNYPVYFVQAFGKIQRNWSNPVAANQKLSCIIYFQIIRSGSILEPSIETSSGIPAYDRACLRAVQASDPMPPLPSEFHDDIIGIHLEFPYQP